ncbi:hypothetical protein KI387_031148, partial [Taxus chinensis]
TRLLLNSSPTTRFTLLTGLAFMKNCSTSLSQILFFGSKKLMSLPSGLAVAFSGSVASIVIFSTTPKTLILCSRWVGSITDFFPRWTLMRPCFLFTLPSISGTSSRTGRVEPSASFCTRLIG